jgi:hypothetical protein
MLLRIAFGRASLAWIGGQLDRLCRPARIDDNGRARSAWDWAGGSGGRVTRFLFTRSAEGADVAGKKRPKSLAQTEKKAPAKAKRPKKTSRGK